MKLFRTILFRVILWLIGVVLSINVAIQIYADEFLLSSTDVPVAWYGMILGASVYRDGRLSDVLRDRVDTALAVYKEGSFERFFVSWDDSDGHGEVRAIVDYLQEKGISEESIVVDGEGFDTYDSMRRARNIYNVDSMLVFTQAFHLSRSVYIANRLWIEAYGVTTDRHVYVRALWFIFREAGARVKAFFDVEILKSQPKYEE